MTVREAREKLEAAVAELAAAEACYQSGTVRLAYVQRRRDDVGPAIDALVAAVREEAAPFLRYFYVADRQGGAGGQVLTGYTCVVCHADCVSGSTAHGILCKDCRAKLTDFLRKARNGR